MLGPVGGMLSQAPRAKQSANATTSANFIVPLGYRMSAPNSHLTKAEASASDLARSMMAVRSPCGRFASASRSTPADQVEQQLAARLGEGQTAAANCFLFALPQSKGFAAVYGPPKERSKVRGDR
jgi:hypothetical protein